MKIDDIEITPTYDDNGQIVHLDIRCERIISISKYCSDYHNLKKRFNIVHYVQNAEDKSDIVGMDFMCNPKYSFQGIIGPKNNMLRIIALEPNSKTKTKLL